MTEIYKNIIELLKKENIEYAEHRHQPVRTSEEAAKVRNSALNEGAKALIFTTGDDYVMIVVPGDQKVNTENLKKTFEFKKLKMASPEEAEKLSGTQVGGVPPFANLFPNPIKIYVAKKLLKNEYIEFNAGDRSISIRMKPKDWAKLVSPIEFDND